jgi:hypothetical protein
MLHIIGVAHRAQARGPGVQGTDAQHAFTRCLDRTIQETQPAFVGEEDSEEALANRRETSIARQVSTARGIEHRFCDPTIAERQALDYKDGQTLELEIFMADTEGLPDDEIHLKGRAIELGRYFPIREKFWLDRLNGCRNQNAAFVCGDAHIETFTRLLEREGVPYRIVERGIGVTNEERGDFRRVVEYLGAHPELQNEDSARKVDKKG